jgi:pimeloyl-ACP methyl ester carboxylesterase
MADSDSNLEVKSGQVAVSDGVNLYYELRSPAKASHDLEKHRLVMIMGAFATLKHFEETAEMLVKHFAKTSTPIEVLTFDNRGIGKSAPAPRVKQSTSMLAEDTLRLINQVWGKNSPVHVYGASLGGMIAQEFATVLVPANRLKSLYLAVTSRGDKFRPLGALGTGVWSAMMPLLIKPDRERMIREVLLPASFSPGTQCERYAQLWLADYDGWWAFGDHQACAAQAPAATTHYVSSSRLETICSSGAPITVHIATQDKLMPRKKQEQLAKLLNANTIVFNHGHLGDENAKSELLQATITHLESAMNKV